MLPAVVVVQEINLSCPSVLGCQWFELTGYKRRRATVPHTSAQTLVLVVLNGSRSVHPVQRSGEIPGGETAACLGLVFGRPSIFFPEKILHLCPVHCFVVKGGLLPHSVCFAAFGGRHWWFSLPFDSGVVLGHCENCYGLGLFSSLSKQNHKFVVAVTVRHGPIQKSFISHGFIV